jgi:hypothetical protein
MTKMRSWGCAVHLRGRLIHTVRAHPHHRQERRLGTILLPILVNQNRPTIVRMPAQSRQGTFRSASLKALDPPDLARITSKEAPSALGGQDP